ncbi:hypothetical protein QL285_008051 [Trifolium repens]|nr:hypothetical protein QL285_008051 [Trifolium repens]
MMLSTTGLQSNSIDTSNTSISPSQFRASLKPIASASKAGGVPSISLVFALTNCPWSFLKHIPTPNLFSSAKIAASMLHFSFPRGGGCHMLALSVKCTPCALEPARTCCH